MCEHKMKQETALNILKTGSSAFITGSAGSGKSYTLQQYLKYIKSELGASADAIAITASTGVAASLIGGVTIHSFSGMGVKDDMTDADINTLFTKRIRLKIALQKVRILIIDEISMLHRKQFELAAKIIAKAKGSNKPFGGIQVIVCGDFFQLPPVSKATAQEENRDRFCFMSPSWVDCKFTICYLTEQHRTVSNSLTGILNAMRDETIDDYHIEEVSTRLNTKPSKDILHLYTTNANVDAINREKLNALETPTIEFLAECKGNEANVKTIINSITAPERLELKIGAKVMFTKNNTDEGYVNGTQGTVVRFDDNNEQSPPYTPVVETLDGSLIAVEPYCWELSKQDEVLASVKQLPLRHAWAITVHKSQGMTLTEGVIDLTKCFEYGLGYVAFSRFKELEGIHLLGVSPDAMSLNPLAHKADKRFKELSEDAETKYFEDKDLKAKQLKFGKSLPTAGKYTIS